MELDSWPKALDECWLLSPKDGFTSTASNQISCGHCWCRTFPSASFKTKKKLFFKKERKVSHFLWMLLGMQKRLSSISSHLYENCTKLQLPLRSLGKELMVAWAGQRMKYKVSSHRSGPGRCVNKQRKEIKQKLRLVEDSFKKQYQQCDCTEAEGCLDHEGLDI